MHRRQLLVGVSALMAVAPLEGQTTVRPQEQFFAALEPVRFTLTVDISRLHADTANDAPTRDGTVSFREGGANVTLPVKVKTHGRWRLTHCEFPPLSITFPADRATGTPFAGLGKVRLTSYCKNHPAYEQYVLQELQLYRAYRLLTPFGHTVRALLVEYVDSRTRRTRATRHAFFIDDREAAAERLESALLKAKGAIASDLQPYHRALMGVFEYMIGNTDFLVSDLHNAFLIGTPQGETIPVPYDFDYSGAVNAIYATPNPVLPIRTVRQRHYRGFCADSLEFRKVFDLLNRQRRAIYALYDDRVGKLLRLEVVSDTKRYFDEFYRVINTPDLARSEIIERCLRRE